jgi:hypothetical protein
VGTGDDIELSAAVHSVGAHAVLTLGGVHWRARLWAQAGMRGAHRPASRPAQSPTWNPTSVLRGIGPHCPFSPPPSLLPNPGLTWYSAFWCTHTPLDTWEKEQERSSEALLCGLAPWVRTHTHEQGRCSGLSGCKLVSSTCPSCHSPVPPHPSLPGLTHHTSRLGSTFQARPYSSVRIPAGMRGAPLCTGWCYTLRVGQVYD